MLHFNACLLLMTISRRTAPSMWAWKWCCSCWNSRTSVTVMTRKNATIGSMRSRTAHLHLSCCGCVWLRLRLSWVSVSVVSGIVVKDYSITIIIIPLLFHFPTFRTQQQTNRHGSLPDPRWHGRRLAKLFNFALLLFAVLSVIWGRCGLNWTSFGTRWRIGKASLFTGRLLIWTYIVSVIIISSWLPVGWKLEECFSCSVPRCPLPCRWCSSNCSSEACVGWADQFAESCWWQRLSNHSLHSGADAETTNKDCQRCCCWVDQWKFRPFAALHHKERPWNSEGLPLQWWC